MQLPLGLRDFRHLPIRTLRSITWGLLHSSARLERPIFIVGSPRSGTTLAVDLFGRHPDVANWSEAGHIWDPAHYDDPEAEHAWGPELATEPQSRRLHRWFEWYRQSEGKSRFVNKHPRNSLRIGYLRRVFPDACFIHVIRDGRAVVSSVLEEIRRGTWRQALPMGGFAKPHRWRELLRDDLAEQTALQWQGIVRAVRESAEQQGDAYMEIRYEALCERPRDTYRALFQFSDLACGDAALANIPERLEESKGWRERLSARERTTIEEAAGELLKELGYLT